MEKSSLQMEQKIDEIYTLLQKNQKIGDWIPQKQAMKFFSYGSTKFIALVKSGHLETAKIGRRRFVKASSIEAYLNSQRESK